MQDGVPDGVESGKAPWKRQQAGRPWSPNILDPACPPTGLLWGLRTLTAIVQREDTSFLVSHDSPGSARGV